MYILFGPLRGQSSLLPGLLPWSLAPLISDQNIGSMLLLLPRLLPTLAQKGSLTWYQDGLLWPLLRYCKAASVARSVVVVAVHKLGLPAGKLL